LSIAPHSESPRSPARQASGSAGARGALDRRPHAARLRRRRSAGRRRPLPAPAPLDEAPAVYEMLQKKEDGAIKIVLEP